MNSVSLRLEATPALARLVRMTAANIAVLSSMSVDRVEDLRDDSASTYADLILTSVCDSYEKLSNPTRLVLDMKADV